MQVFDSFTFSRFLGPAVYHKTYNCGTAGSFAEDRYVVTEAAIKQYRHTLRDTIYSDHSAFDFSDEMVELGLSALCASDV